MGDNGIIAGYHVVCSIKLSQFHVGLNRGGVVGSSSLTPSGWDAWFVPYSLHCFVRIRPIKCRLKDTFVSRNAN
jgi:hypothetical protein